MSSRRNLLSCKANFIMLVCGNKSHQVKEMLSRRKKSYQMRSHVTMGDHSVIIYYVKHMLILGTKSCFQAKLSYLFYLSGKLQ